MLFNLLEIILNLFNPNVKIMRKLKQSYYITDLSITVFDNIAEKLGY